MATAFIEMGALRKMNDRYSDIRGEEIPEPTLWIEVGDDRTLIISWVGDSMDMELLSGEDSISVGRADGAFTDWANWLEGKGL